jgi:hypothetical protein
MLKKSASIELAARLGLAAFGQSLGVALLRGEADAPGRGPSQDRHGDRGAAGDELLRMRPTAETEQTNPSRLSSTTSLRLPQMGLSLPSASTTRTSAPV